MQAVTFFEGAGLRIGVLGEIDRCANQSIINSAAVILRPAAAAWRDGCFKARIRPRADPDAATILAGQIERETEKRFRVVINQRTHGDGRRVAAD